MPQARVGRNRQVDGMKKAIITVGLGFGDEGKGPFTSEILSKR
jgi:hypothetical protein